MSTRASKRPVKGYVRDPHRRKMVLDLNVAPSVENRAQLGATTSRGDAQGVQVSGRDGGSAPVNGRLLNAPIDVEAIDDDVVISSPTRFAEARNHSRRNQVVTVVLDEDSDVRQNRSEEPTTRLTLSSFNSRGRSSSNRTIINCELYNLEKNQGAKRKRAVTPSKEPPPPPPESTKPKEPIFSCAICMGALVEETSTTCGHIFCMKCIKAAIAAQKKCPTCRHKLTANNIHRVYLPTTN
ncbi:hypothetical protein CKAN_01601900 [Cinnamomum micranthum f. kanehirae]|uniref:RING-type domain-containing protein n=1 Tax=Cinnamomum micranthum f. kanehirae TaxID=337451 RepID=A0A443P8H0_9MAGN|nr:hypothetical protein CKAN_01601900 [Cinnamomum micranthum f. kanehirae]